MGFTREELERFEGAEVDDLVRDDVALLFVGINPGLWTAAADAHFAHPGNRFWPALYEAGIVERPLDVSDGMSPEDAAYVLDRGIGITNLARRATARADELGRDELREGADALRDKVGRWQPKAVAVVGVTAYRTAFRRPKADKGRQDEDLAGVPLWVLGNPSGLNAHETVQSLAAAYAEPASAAGVISGTCRARSSLDAL